MDQTLVFKAKSDIKVAIDKFFTGKEDFDFGFRDWDQFCWGTEFDCEFVRVIFVLGKVDVVVEFGSPFEDGFVDKRREEFDNIVHFMVM